MPPLPPGQWTDEVHEFYALLDPAATREHGTHWMALKIMANHPPLSLAFGAWNRFVMQELALDPRLREIAILRVANRYDSAYELHHHAKIGLAVGLSEEQVAATAEGPQASIWSDTERLVVQAVDDMIDRAETSDATWNGLMQALGPRRLMELLYAIGTYAMTAWIFNSMRVPVES
ncbi:MAG: carboxymuconolactone decarboxylase family protein [Sandarakinorhabdus sp.]|nr:carboxymuconolactone decarboxylase family protein [Sandarakinorhabdus sp.]